RSQQCRKRNFKTCASGSRHQPRKPSCFGEAMTSPTETAATAPKPRRRAWRWLLGFALLLIATPVAFLLVSSYLDQRELQAVLDELDRTDPGWRWEEMLAARAQIPEERNSALVVVAVEKMLDQVNFQGVIWPKGKSFDELAPPHRLDEQHRQI